MIHADAQNLDICSRELGQPGLVRRDLICSYGCPRQREESQDHCPAFQIAEAHILAKVTGQGKIGCFLSHLQHHTKPPDGLNVTNIIIIVNYIANDGSDHQALWELPWRKGRCGIFDGRSPVKNTTFTPLPRPIPKT
jgi:hypothetical protein